MVVQPVRMCVGCRKKQVQNDLIRYTIVKDQLSKDAIGRVQARGYYVCSEECLIKAKQIVEKSNRRARK